MAENKNEPIQNTAQLAFERRLSGESIQESIMDMAHLNDMSEWDDE
jgi:hypothetical protein